MNVRVHDARNRLHLREQPLRDLIVIFSSADNLKINRRRKAEVEDLVGNVCWREEKDAIGKLCVKPVAKLSHIELRISFARLERNQDVTV